MEKELQKIGHRIKLLRIENKISQKVLAKKTVYIANTFKQYRKWQSWCDFVALNKNKRIV